MDFDFSTESIIPDTGNSITISGTGSLNIPIGTSIERPSNPPVGAIRYNSTIGSLELYNGNNVTGWTDIANNIGNTTPLYDVLTGNLSAGGYRITNVANGLDIGDVINNGQLISAITTHASDTTIHLTTNQHGLLAAITASSAEINYLSGITNNIQSTLNTKQDSLGFTAENVANKGAIGGYAGLDATGHIPTNQLPTLVYSVNTRTGAITLSKSDVGLDQVDNTTDANKPISTAVQTALNTKQDSLGFTAETVANKGAIGGYAGLDDAGHVPTNQLPTLVYSVNTRTGAITLSKSDVGLDQIDNTTDANKPISTAVQTALNAKQTSLGFTAENVANKGAINGYAGLDSTGHIPTNQIPPTALNVLTYSSTSSLPIIGLINTLYIDTTTTYGYIWNGTSYVELNTYIPVTSVNGQIGNVSISTADIGLENVNNTSDLNKPISTATQTALNLKLNSSVYSASDVLTKVKTVDGDGSGLDADMLDGIHSSGFSLATHTHIDSYQPLNTNLTNISATSGSVGMLKTDGTGNWTVDTNTYLTTATGTITIVGDVTGTGNISNVVTTLSNSGVTAGTYTKVVVDIKGRITTGSMLTASDITTTLTYTPVNIAGDTMTGALTLYGSPVNSLHAATKGYVDGILSGISWKNPIFDPNVISDNLNTPPTPILDELHIIGANPTGDWSTFVPGTVVSYNYTTNQWVPRLDRPVTIGDRFGILFENSTNQSPQGGLVGKLSNIAQITDATPGSITYSFYTPLANDALFVKNTMSIHFGHSYTYDNSSSSWIEFSGPAAISTGVGLTLLNNTISVSTASTSRIVVSSNGIDLASGIVTAGTYNVVTVDTYGRVTTGTNPTTISGYGITDAAPLSHISDTSLHLTSNQHNLLNAITATSTEVNYISGTTSSIQTQLNTKQSINAKGVAGGYAGLDSYGLVPISQLPTSTHLIEYNTVSLFPTTGATDALYIATDSNYTYYWNGTVYVQMSGGIGGVSSVNTRTGDVVLSTTDVGLGNVNNTSDLNKPISTATQTALNLKLNSSVYSASDVLNKIKTVDGNGSGLDADLFDGLPSSSYSQSTHTHNGAYQPLNVDLTAIVGLTAQVGFLEKLSTGVWALNTTVSGGSGGTSANIVLSGDVSGSGTTSITTSLNNNGVVAGTYNTATSIYPITIDATGRITNVGTITTISPSWMNITNLPTTLAGYGITNAVLSNQAITAGTATKITYDSKGLVLSGTQLSATDIPSLNWSKITTGTPTTLAGYGITDALTSSNANIYGNLFSSGTISTVGDIFTTETGSIISSNHVYDMVGDVRSSIITPISTDYTIRLVDNGTCLVVVAGTISIPPNIFSMGNNITLYNNSSELITIDSSMMVAAYIAGVDVPTNLISIGARGMCTILFYNTNSIVVSGYVQ
jgi:hypothetical protein